MKIDNHDQIQPNLYPETRTTPTPSEGKEFGTLLKESVEKTNTEAGGTQPTTMSHSLKGLPIKISTGFDRQLTLERTDHLIGLLDQYRHKLADPAITLKNIDPVIRQIQEELKILSPILDSLPQDEGLKKIVNEALVTASLEVTKFYRGDYTTF